MIARLGDSLLSFATASSQHALRNVELLNEFAQCQAPVVRSILTYVTDKWNAFKAYVVELWESTGDAPSPINRPIVVDFGIDVFGMDEVDIDGSDIDDDEDWEDDYVPRRRWQMRRINAKYAVDRSTRKRTNKNRTRGVARDYKCRR